ncbi:MAG: hypothetical protein WBQ08_08890 [Candidatus Sulfotelmatobacter sp.]
MTSRSSVSTKPSTYLALVTMVMSVPLLLSYNLKFGPFPRGLVYALAWSWSVVSYFAVPALLATECVVTGWIVLKRTGTERSAVLPWHILAILLAILGETVAIVVSHHRG